MNNRDLTEKFTENITKINKEYQRPIQVVPVEIPVEDPAVLKERHRQSIVNYPDIPVDEDEFVLVSLRRHSIGLIGIISTVLLLFVVLISAWILVCFTPNTYFDLSPQIKNSLSLIFGSFIFLSLIAGYIGYSTYTANRFIITNERAIQWIVLGLLNRKKQAIRLESCEDISFSQNGLLQHIFDYGTIRLSTTGDESTYTFILAKSPAKAVEIIGEIVESARENQPISNDIFKKAKQISVK